ncbi:MAG: sulfatase [Saprospiraceae bacterium]|nr:sulfatase [Saprospiraceae bacterium]
MIKHIILLAAGLLLMLHCTDPEESMQMSTLPNIVLITADDHGIQLGCYGDSIAQTPNLDQLSREGVRFTRAYVTQASCSSSRSSMLTGLYPHQNGQIGLAHRGFSMDSVYPNLVSMLKQHGYRTGIIGKLHVNPSEAFPFDFAMTKSSATRDVRWVSDTARQFVQSGSAPFFLYLNYSDPHVKFFNQVRGIPPDPIDSTEVIPFHFQMIDHDQQLARIAGYYNCVSRLDQGVGMIMQDLQTLGMSQNTVVIYLGDHGAPFSRGKTTCYEAGIQIPLMIKYPQHVNPNSISSKLVSTIDLYPTILDILGLPKAFNLSGRSLLAVQKPNNEISRSFLFSEMNYHTHLNFAPKRAVRNDRFKLIHNILFDQAEVVPSVDADQAYTYSRNPKYAGTKVRAIFDRLISPPEYELYDLVNDPHEFINLAENDAFAPMLDTLMDALHSWRTQTGDPFLDKETRELHMELTQTDKEMQTKRRM